ncbi:MAG: hypothetical protein KGJ74_11345 [Betaproteobacteria bacterium]|nr:hypothetical protein [Betaproteobacteria bacterium]MDE2130248.1 hypothetical protein [Betaproteobacteria bacterium]
MQTALTPSQDQESRRAELLINGVANAAITIQRSLSDKTDSRAIMRAIMGQIERVKAGDLSDLEGRLVAHIATLDNLFHEFMDKAKAAPSPRMLEMYTRLALKAQSQAVRAAEAISGMKMGPLIVAKQVNMANGPQQVNNRQETANE